MTVPTDLFRRYTPLHEGVQEAAMQAGWTPPWVKEKQIEAGKLSGITRGLRTILAGR